MNRSEEIKKSIRQVEAANRKRKEDAENKKYEEELQLKIEANQINKNTTRVAFVALLVSTLSLVVSILAYYKQ